ncbi:MAG: glutamine-hydrolyzing carbamoyl-phosphate synthase small subunit [Oscillospiraceae bacterium]|nr:glutamine-hydrolyzing carbamoyl-phosphate synthase small subunit [Oscillospiraceae bacterium]
MERNYTRQLILEDGSVYPGCGFGSGEERVCEVVFNTSPVGYQEILSDPSYTDQAVVMAYPLIGNYGMAAEDYETENPTLGGLIVRDYNDLPSNFRSVNTLSEVMERYHIPGISGIDTRKLVRSIRDHGSRLGLLTGTDTTVEEALARLSAYVPPRDAVSRVSRRRPAEYPVDNARFHVVAVDCGMKLNIVRSLNARGCSVTVVPFDTDPGTVEQLKPDGVFISNGPGDPTDVTPTISLVKALLGKYPMFGICLGHQIIALAYGARTYKLKFGHRGGNHPVRQLDTGKIEITSQNHSYAVSPESMEALPLKPTHINILDNTVEGAACPEDRVFSVQYHPESAPGPQDSGYLFDRFLKLMEVSAHA